MPRNTLAAPHRAALRALARETDGIDVAAYRRFDKDPFEPIIGLGETRARIALLGRDPGREEVRHGVPFVGAGGQLVRRTVYRHRHGREMPDFEASLAIGGLFFWSNTVPYKPVGNKAWSMAVKRRFQPLMSTVLLEYWQGRRLITLGREAFFWLGIGRCKADRARLEHYWRRPDRFEASIELRLASADACERTLAVHPLPHPSPLNANWYKHFPDLLRLRLCQLEACTDDRPG